MRVIVATLGSAGDLYPFIAVAQELKAQGQQVQFLSQEPFRTAVENAGLEFFPIASTLDHQRTLEHPKLWRSIDGFGVLWRHLCIPALEPAWRFISNAAIEAPRLTVFASPLVLGARVARETYRFKLITGITAPTALRSMRDPQFIGALRVPRWAPNGLRLAFWAALDRLKLEPMAREKLHPFRFKLGLPEIKVGTFSEWLMSPDRIVGMFPASFAAKASDWPERVRLTDFPLYRPDEHAPLPVDIKAFIESGTWPVLIFGGSAGTFSFNKICACVEELRRRRRRTLVVASTLTDIERSSLSTKDSLVVRAVPLNKVLPSVEAIIHHGGIGTIAECLAAGVPQWIWPSGYDQYDNAERVARHQQGVVLRHPRDLEKTLSDQPPAVEKHSTPNSRHLPAQVSLPGCSAIERITQSIISS